MDSETADIKKKKENPLGHTPPIAAQVQRATIVKRQCCPSNRPEKQFKIIIKARNEV